MSFEIFSFDKTKCVSPTSFPVKATKDKKYVFVNFLHHRMNEYEGMHHSYYLAPLEDFRESFVSFQLT